jgi:transposase-like protein
MGGIAKDKSAVIGEIPAACADERAAVEFMERQRWGDMPCCPRCNMQFIYQMKNRAGERQADFRWRCRVCAKAGRNAQFTVRTGTVFEDSRIPLRHWCYAFWRACTSKKGVSALEIKRHTGLSYKSALFLLHRIRYAMQQEHTEKLQGDVIADETFIGGKPRYPGQRKPKKIVMAIVERGGSIRVPAIPDVTAKTLKEAIRKHVRCESRILSDENASYHGIGLEYAGGHETVNHSMLEYFRNGVTTNDAESFFALIKRGINGIYHAVSRKHLGRYLAEFEFRWNGRKLEDGERTIAAIQAAEGKRLSYAQHISA